MNTTAQSTPVRASLPNSASIAVRKKAALSPPIFLTTRMVKSKHGRNTARLPNSDEYAATGPARYDNEANTRAVRDWILRLFNLPSRTPGFFDLDQPGRQLPVQARPKTDYFSIYEYAGAMGTDRKNCRSGPCPLMIAVQINKLLRQNRGHGPLQQVFNRKGPAARGCLQIHQNCYKQ
jgi:hypothetical protein